MKMRKYAIAIFMILFTAIMLIGGCNQGRNGKPEENDTQSKEEISFLVANDESWHDNSLDKYSAVINLPLRYSELRDAVYGGAEQYVLGNGTATVFKKHLFQTVDDCWDELRTVNDKGEEVSYRLNFWKGELNQAWALGSFYDGNHYLMMNVEYDDDEKLLYRFFETNEALEIQRSFYVEGLDENGYEFPRQMLVDAMGNLHLITDRLADRTVHYYVVIPNGNSLIETEKSLSLEQECSLFYLYDGRVGLYADKELLVADAESGKVAIVAETNWDFSKCILWDESTFLYADNDGLHKRALSGANDEMIYNWSNHGITYSEILDLQSYKDQSIQMIYVSHEGVNYLRLLPTDGETSIIEIEFAVSSLAMRKYQTAVSDFNKKYPVWHVKLKEYKDLSDPSLVTRLIAGDGPQLLDSYLVGFSSHEELWEPMDDFYKQLNLDEVLLPNIIENCSIDGIPYGVTTDFVINTVIAFEGSPEEWDYETFINYLSGNDIFTKSIYIPRNGSDGFSFLSNFFFHDSSETFLYDATKCSVNYDGKEFRQILEIAKRYMKKENWANVDDFRSGASPCAVVSIGEPEDLACLRVWGKDQLRFVGFPTQNGSSHFLEGADPLCVRKNAPMEEKQLAYTFLKYLLSYDVQKQNDRMSVRKDVLEEQVNRMDEYSYTCLNGFPQFYLGENVDLKNDYETLRKLLENAKPKRSMAVELRNIYVEELGGYLSDAMTEDELINHLKNRILLYIEENQNQLERD